jgi:triacylglycerol lipase
MFLTQNDIVWISPRLTDINEKHHEGPFPHSEDCLTINVIRPRATHQLPVGVFIYAGQNHGGGSSDPRYNLSFIVQTASDAGLPFIAVSFNYRASMWGFLPGRQSLGTGNTNLGLRDQRLALRWVQENISIFGGDNTKVTIWGGSSGADDVGFHLIAHGGRDDRLFRAAIMQSGTPVAKMANAVEGLQDMYQDLVTQAGCSASDDVLECLRTVPYEQLNTAFVDSEKGNSPRMLAFALKALDGNFIPTYGSLALLRQAIAKVPIITGLMTNEGSSSITLDVRTWADEREHLIGAP